MFAVLSEKKISKPLIFWRMSKTEFPILGDLALKLLQVPASSAQIERLFSNWGNIHSLLRNRLTFDNSKKLIQIYFTLKYEYPYVEVDYGSEDEIFSVAD